MQVVCNYGGGTLQDNTAQTGSIPWGSPGQYAVVPANDPAIAVQGTVAVTFGATPGSTYSVYFTGSMSLAPDSYNSNLLAETIDADQTLVAAQTDA